MIKSILIALGLVLVQACAVSSVASAQTNPNCIGYNQYCPACGDPLLPGEGNCQTEAPFLEVCQIPSSQCAPGAGAQETACGPCSHGVAGNPISLASGDTYIEENDVNLPGLSGGLILQRTWNSLWPATQTAYQIGMFGPNWRSNFEERVFLGVDNYMKYGRGDGSFWSFGYAGGGWKTVAPANVPATLTQGSSDWTITFQNGEQRLFDKYERKAHRNH